MSSQASDKSVTLTLQLKVVIATKSWLAGIEEKNFIDIKKGMIDIR